MNTTIKNIELILTSEYSTKSYVEFVQNVFSSMRLIAHNNYRKEFSNFSSHIMGSTHIGEYITSDNKKVAIFSVELKNAQYVQNSRSTQRSYAKKLIEAGNCDAALVAFYTTGDVKWRISFVRLDYEMKIEHGKLKTSENITPAKRYSFLVGKDEPCHTAIDRFQQFIVSGVKHSLDEIEEAFSVERVTKEFFELYCEKFYQLQEYLDSNEDFVEESKRCGFTSEQFAKKLMGQIVFLYFLQKKGWLGVNVWPQTLTEKEYKNLFFVTGAQGRIIKEHLDKIYVPVEDGSYRLLSRALDEIPDEDEEVIANHITQILVNGNEESRRKVKTWGAGSKKFLRTIFEFSQKHKGHFYEYYLEPLFYNTLNKNRGNMGYCPFLHCRVPFLSGGLFDPLDGYDWRSNHFDIPDKIFSNKKDENDRTADGILDIFDRYNFTMSEDEPLEREVAIDPEMLGKIFENLLEVRDRKSKGAFYTPREIVHYMCQESLVNYLVRKTGISETALRDFILYGDFMKDEDTDAEKRKGNGGMYISEELFKVGEDGTIVVNRLIDVDNALATVRVADPAVGSGAFPLGMVNEIVRARQNITAYISIGMNSNSKRLMYKNERSPYWLKYQAIKNSIYAVDIEPSAVDIAQLRLWLSLVIDDEVTPDAANDFEGHRNPLPLPNLECNIICGNSLIDEFMGVRLVNSSDLIGTSQLGEQLDIFGFGFDSILVKLLEAQDELFKCDEPNRKQKLKNDIQALKDMVISHQLDGVSDEIQEAYNAATRLSSKPFVLWNLEFARVFRENGGFDIVIGNPPYSIVFDEKAKACYERDYPTFRRNNDLYVAFYEKSFNLTAPNGIISLITPNTYLNGDYFKNLRSLLTTKTKVINVVDYKNNAVFADPTVYVAIGIFMNTTPIFDYSFKMRVAQEDIFTFVDYDITLSKGTDEPIKPVNSLFQKIVSNVSFFLDEKFEVRDVGFNYWSKGKGKVRGGSIGSRVLYAGERQDERDTPYLKGRDIDRYFKGAPSNYLKHNYADLLVEGDTFRFSAEVMESKKKIIYRQTANRLIATIDDEGMYNDKTIHCVIPKTDDISHLYLLGLLNSQLFVFLYREISQETEGRAFSQVKTVYVKKLPIIVPEDYQLVKQVEELVLTILQAKSNNLYADTSAEEEIIESLVYKIYGVSPEDISSI